MGKQQSGQSRLILHFFIPPQGCRLAEGASVAPSLFLGSSRDLGEVEVDRQGAGKLAVSKHTT
ncbi:hypothetical protein, partial [Aeromonas allosaccharophila]